MSQKFTLVLGGAASGKSGYAENLIVASALPKHYIATSRIWDDEMAQKVDLHKTSRGPNWITHEAELDLAPVLSRIPAEHAVLIDCATMWLTNHLMDETDLHAAQTRLLQDLTSHQALRVIVSNEVGQGIVPADPLSRRFRQAQGELNQHLAAAADTVIFVTAGLPQILKGSL